MKTIIVTGANSGIGGEAALNLAKQGHRIIMLCRDSDKSKQMHIEIAAQSGNEEIILLPVDLSDQDSIRAAVADIKRRYEVIDVLVNNAGVYKVKQETTPQGIEMTLAVNFLAPFMLSEMLLENLEAVGHGRIINVVSELYKRGTIKLDDLSTQSLYKAGDAYANSKLATVLYTIELAERTRDRGITVNALHPGVLATNAFRDYPGFFMKIMKFFLEKPQKGGERISYLAVSDEVKENSGKYFYKTESRELAIPETEYGKTERLLQYAAEVTGIGKERK